MRAPNPQPLASLVLLSLLVVAAGCARKPLDHDEYPFANRDIDLRGGDYTPGTGAAEPLPLSTPPVATRRGLPDAPVVEKPVAANPVHPAVIPVAASRLVAVLPQPPKDWTAQEANAVGIPTSRGLMTEASRSYWSGAAVMQGATPDGREGHRSIDVVVVDRGQTGTELVDAVAAAADERRAVTAAPVKVGEFSGQEFDAGPGLKQLDLDVADRFLVRVRGGNVTFEDLRAWAALVPLQDLAGMR